MEVAILFAAAVAVLFAGVGVTLFIADRVSTSDLQRAGEHGRFAGLGSSSRQIGPTYPAAGELVAVRVARA